MRKYTIQGKIVATKFTMAENLKKEVKAILGLKEIISPIDISCYSCSEKVPLDKFF